MYTYTFDGDDNIELEKIQQFIYQSVQSYWDIFTGAKAILINACNTVNTEESKRIAEFALTKTQFDPHDLKSVSGIIAARYRYLYGSSQLDLGLEEHSRMDQLVYQSKDEYKYFFLDKDPIQWKHFRGFHDYYEKLVRKLLLHTSFVNAVNYNTILRHMTNERNDLRYRMISDAVFDILNIKVEENENLDMSSMIEDRFLNSKDWNHYVHPGKGEFNPDNISF